MLSIALTNSIPYSRIKAIAFYQSDLQDLRFDRCRSKKQMLPNSIRPFKLQGSAILASGASTATICPRITPADRQLYADSSKESGKSR
ncbi:MAG: hypothetical protein QNJ34_19655 [Xenococcaceae cyanobacterium MO_188.B29]|nr:hypothetical protein [Xenococcaceae cyanobacterium MO_188.B29]